MRTKTEIMDDLAVRVKDGLTVNYGVSTCTLEALLDIRDTLVRMGPSDYAFEQNRLMEEDMRTSGRARARPGKKKED